MTNDNLSHDLSVREMYTNISEDDLEKAIGDIQLAHPNWGNRLMYGYLVSVGIRVPFHSSSSHRS